MARIPLFIEPISWTSPVYKFWCPACSRLHFVNVKKHYFNESLLFPTLLPPTFTEMAPGTFCEVYLENGVLHYGKNSTHTFAGKEMLMVPLYKIPQNEKE